MSEAKPLYVQVAEALGRVPCGRWRMIATGLAGPVYEKACTHPDCYPEQMPPRYDADWAATGPLIEKYHLHVGEEVLHREDGTREAVCWIAGTWDSEEGAEPEYDHLIGRGLTPLLAVCHLILMLKEAGRL